MSIVSDLLAAKGVELSDEERAAIQREEQETEQLRSENRDLRLSDQEADLKSNLEKIEKMGFDSPGTKKYVESVFMSDDGGPAIELSEKTESGSRTQPVKRTATEVLKGFIDSIPLDDKGRVTLSQQAQRLPDDDKPPSDNPEGGGEDDKRTTKEKADALSAELSEAGLVLEGAPDSNGGSS